MIEWLLLCFGLIIFEFFSYIIYYWKHRPSSIWYIQDVRSNPDWYLIEPRGWDYTDGATFWYTYPISYHEYLIRSYNSYWVCISASRSALTDRAECIDWFHVHPWNLYHHSNLPEFYTPIYYYLEEILYYWWIIGLGSFWLYIFSYF